MVKHFCTLVKQLHAGKTNFWVLVAVCQRTKKTWGPTIHQRFWQVRSGLGQGHWAARVPWVHQSDESTHDGSFLEDGSIFTDGLFAIQNHYSCNIYTYIQSSHGSHDNNNTNWGFRKPKPPKHSPFPYPTNTLLIGFMEIVFVLAAFWALAGKLQGFKQLVSGWTTHLQTYAQVKLDHLPGFLGENRNYLKQPPRKLVYQFHLHPGKWTAGT